MDKNNERLVVTSIVVILVVVTTVLLLMHPGPPPGEPEEVSWSLILILVIGVSIFTLLFPFLRGGDLKTLLKLKKKKRGQVVNSPADDPKAKRIVEKARKRK